MNKEFVPYEQALALKEFGFDEPCFGVYGYNKLSKSVPDNLINKNVISYIQDIIKVEEFVLDFNDLRNCNIGDDVSAPTFSQAFRWFREKYVLDSIVQPTYSTKYQYRVFNIETKSKVQVYGDYMGKEFNTYEEAELACLKKLIEICKTKILNKL
jgi:hypothetical protein